MTTARGGARGMDARAILSTAPIFEGLSATELDGLLAITATRRLRTREVLFRKGAEGSSLFGVLRGRLRVSTTGVDGKELTFRYMEPGELVGEMALLDPAPRSATVEAMEATELLTLHRRDLMPFLTNNPSIAVNMAALMVRRVRALSDQLEDSLLLSLPARVAKKLLSLAKAYGKRMPEGILIDLKLPQQQLGELVGATRESMNKVLRTWTEKELVLVENRYITLRDPEEIERISRQLHG